MKTKADLNAYIVNVQGKDFITFPGLLAEAHAQGLTSINTELINTESKAPIVRATVILQDNGITKTFTGFGDATENNVAKKVAGALLRMAETRAVARALRFACNIDMTAIEELGGNDEDTHKPSSFIPKKTSPVGPMTKPLATQTTPVNKPVPNKFPAKTSNWAPKQAITPQVVAQEPEPTEEEDVAF